MSKESIAKGPNYIHPEKPSAVGSRNSLNRDDRNEYLEAATVVEEEIDKILNHVRAKLPPEVLDKLDVMGGVKEKLHNYYNQNLQNMQNRYMVTIEDELLKKYRDLIDREEFNQLNRYTPRAISEILEKIGGFEQFDTGEIEKSIANIFGHLQGHLQQGVQELERKTNTMFRQKSDVGSFIRKENAYAVVKCAFKNNPIKPKTVVDVKMAINVLDSELIAPIYHYQRSLQELLRETISQHIHFQIDSRINELNRSRVEEGQKELSTNETVAEKLNELENYLSFEDNPQDEHSKQYDYVAKRFFDSLNEMNTDGLENRAYIKDHVKRILENDNIQNFGFNRIINTLTTILDSSKLGYQCINNYKNARTCIIQEYTSVEKEELPDESFVVRISYYNAEQIHALKEAYDMQAAELQEEIEKAAKVVEKISAEFNARNGRRTYRDISKKVLGETPSFEKDAAGVNGRGVDSLWHDVSLYRPLDPGNKVHTYREFNNELKKKLGILQNRVYGIYGNNYPKPRRILDERIKFLKEAFQKLSNRINPHHIQQGLILEVDITSVKRKKTTMNAMSNVLNEFLLKVSRGFLGQTVKVSSLRSLVESEDMEKKFTSVLQKMDQKLEEVKA